MPSWDVNRDGSIDVSDIIAISNSFGQKGKSDADVNGDGVVNILDLAIVCKYFNQSQTPTAPSLGLMKLDSLQLLAIKNLYNQINSIPSDDPDILLTKELLGRIIAENMPKIANSQLMQNYPNPFNPETWIPYQLKDDSQVTIKIYSVSGDLIRKLDLGYKSAGMYSDRDKSAYWDGRNEFGEHVSSGIYFYTIKAGDFSATKKMIISK
jgi:hypothetical protein